MSGDIATMHLSAGEPCCLITITLLPTSPNDTSIQQLYDIFKRLHNLTCSYDVELDSRQSGLSVYLPYMKEIFTRQKHLHDKGVLEGKPGMRKMTIRTDASSLIIAAVQKMIQLFFPEKQIEFAA